MVKLYFELLSVSCNFISQIQLGFHMIWTMDGKETLATVLSIAPFTNHAGVSRAKHATVVHSSISKVALEHDRYLSISFRSFVEFTCSFNLPSAIFLILTGRLDQTSF